MNVIVIGSGIGGLTAAIACHRAGMNVQLYERAPQLGEVGAGISLWANALRALDWIGVGESIRQSCLPLQSSEIRLAAGRRIAARMLATDLERLVDYSPVVALIHRAELVSLLASALPTGVCHYGKRCVEVVSTVEDVRATFADGTESRADLLIAADGIHSTVRACLWDEAPARYAGYTCYRGVCPRPASVPAGMVGEWWGRGMRFGITTLKGDRVYWFATRNAPANVKHDDTPASVRAYFEDWADPVPELLALTPNEAYLHNDIIDRPPRKPWTKGRAILIGDAAHPTTPNLGQGGCMAIEDGVMLARLIQQSPDLSAALAKFERLRFPRTSAVTRQSWQFGSVAQWQSPAACAVRDLALIAMTRLMGPAGLLRFVRYRIEDHC